MRHTTTYFFLAVVGFFISVSSAFADVKIGVVDLEKALARTQAGQEAQKQYATEVKAAQGKVDEQKGELEKARDAFSKQRKSMNEKAAQEKEKELVAKEQGLRKTFQSSQEQLRKRNTELVGGLVKKMRDVVEEVAKKDGYTVVLERGGRGVVYADQAVDVTDEVVKAFDAAGK